MKGRRTRNRGGPRAGGGTPESRTRARGLRRAGQVVRARLLPSVRQRADARLAGRDPHSVHAWVASTWGCFGRCMGGSYPLARSWLGYAPGPMKGPVLALNGVSRRFGDFLAVREASVEIAPGAIHAIIGENGAGKSTLLKMAAGALAPWSGQVRIDGRQLRRPRPGGDPARGGDGAPALHAGGVPAQCSRSSAWTSEPRRLRVTHAPRRASWMPRRMALDGRDSDLSNPEAFAHA